MDTILLCQFRDSRVERLRSALAQNSYQVIDCPAQEALDLSSPGDADLVIIDASGGGDAEGKCSESVGVYPDVPVVALVAEDVPSGPRCRLLTRNNVMQFPFTLQELLLKIQSLLSCEQWAVIQVGELSLNIKTRCVRRGNASHRLTPKQAQLLQVFMCYPERTLTRRFLMETIWDTDYMGDTRTLDVHVRWLRERIEKNPAIPQYLRTVRGVGYRFGVPPQDAHNG